jgi:hypothetical protein
MSKPTYICNEQELLLAQRDAETYGTSYIMTVHRKWWNPLRYIKCELKQKRIDPLTIHRQVRDSNARGKEK